MILIATYSSNPPKFSLEQAQRIIEGYVNKNELLDITGSFEINAAGLLYELFLPKPHTPPLARFLISEGVHKNRIYTLINTIEEHCKVKFNYEYNNKNGIIEFKKEEGLSKTKLQSHRSSRSKTYIDLRTSIIKLLK